MNKIISRQAAAELVNDHDTVVVCGCENLLLPDRILSALEERYISTGHPCGLTDIHPVIYGMGEHCGLEHFAHEGFLSRSIGSGFSYLKSSRMSQLVRENKLEAYVAPMGTIYRMIQNISCGEPYTLTDVGLHTFVDPRQSGGRFNARTTKDIVSLIELGGRQMLCYPNPSIDVAIIRAHTSDENGNLALEQEPVSLGIYSMAVAAKACGGKVIAQVNRIVANDSIPPKRIVVPGIFVDAVVLEEDVPLSGGALNFALSGENRMPLGRLENLPLDIRKVILRRAAMEIGTPPKTVNLGVGIPGFLPRILVEDGTLDGITFFTEHGSLGGVPGDRSNFGTNINPSALLDPTQVFQAFRGGLLDISFLGCGQMDQFGNVNVSSFNGIVPGCGGFIDIAYQTKKLVFCGTFSSGGAAIDVADGGLTIHQEGKFFKLVPNVEQITLNGPDALRKGQSILLITERAVFQVMEDGLHLTEIANGVDLQRDILAHIPFPVTVNETCKPMDPALFT